MALNVCDSGVLGTLFKHLHNDSQIDTFLAAYESIRRERIKTVLQIEMMNVHLMTMPAGEEKDIRDETLRARRDAGVDVFAPESNSKAINHWEVTIPLRYACGSWILTALH
jgi:salicylate hydroxylase